MNVEESRTNAVLRDVAERLKELDEAELQQEIGSLQVELQDLNWQMQERQMLLQLRQLQAQRRAQGAGGLPRSRSRPDRDIQRRLEEIHRAVESLDDQAINTEIAKLQNELQAVNRQIQERQHMLSLKQMLNQAQAAAIGISFNQQVMSPGFGFQVGFPTVQAPLGVQGAQGGPRLDAATKRKAILELLREQPSRRWKPNEIKRTLTQRGLQGLDEGTPIRNLLWKMHNEDMIEHPAPGVYSLSAVPPSNESAGVDEAVQS